MSNKQFTVILFLLGVLLGLMGATIAFHYHPWILEALTPSQLSQ